MPTSPKARKLSLDSRKPLSPTSSNQPLSPNGGDHAALPKKSLGQGVYITVKPKEHVAPAHLHAQKNLTNSGDAALFVYPVSAGSSSASASPDGSEDIHVQLADALARRCNLPTIRLNYHHALGPAESASCLADMRACMQYLDDKFQCYRYLLVGWSDGAQAVLDLATQDDRVAAVALVSPQNADDLSPAVGKLAPRPLLLVDLGSEGPAAKQLFEAYGSSKGHRQLQRADTDTSHEEPDKTALETEESVLGFVAKVFDKEVAKSPVVRKQELPAEAKT